MKIIKYLISLLLFLNVNGYDLAERIELINSLTEKIYNAELLKKLNEKFNNQFPYKLLDNQIFKGKIKFILLMQYHEEPSNESIRTFVDSIKTDECIRQVHDDLIEHICVNKTFNFEDCK